MTSDTVDDASRPWRLQHNHSVPSGTLLTYPEYPAGPSSAHIEPRELPPYVKLRANGKSGLFRTQMRRGAKGKELHVTPSTWPDVPEGTACTLEEMSLVRWNVARALADAKGKTGLVALAIGLTGTMIQGIQAVGRIKPYFLTSPGLLAFWAIVGVLLQLLGLILLYAERELFRRE
jgi:hypothetical protein